MPVAMLCMRVAQSAVKNVDVVSRPKMSIVRASGVPERERNSTRYFTRKCKAYPICYGRLVKRNVQCAAGPKELEMFKMTAAAGAMNPSVQAKVEALVELCDLEFGLTGVRFEEVMDMVGQCYTFTPTGYTSGAGLPSEVCNEPNTNNGSCKVFAFAKLNDLDEEATLRLFCEHYEQVLGDPEGNSHLNIRNFMANGWQGLVMETSPLRLKASLDDPSDTDGI